MLTFWLTFFYTSQVLFGVVMKLGEVVCACMCSIHSLTECKLISLISLFQLASQAVFSVMKIMRIYVQVCAYPLQEHSQALFMVVMKYEWGAYIHVPS